MRMTTRFVCGAQKRGMRSPSAPPKPPQLRLAGTTQRSGKMAAIWAARSPAPVGPQCAARPESTAATTTMTVEPIEDDGVAAGARNGGMSEVENIDPDGDGAPPLVEDAPSVGPSLSRQHRSVEGAVMMGGGQALGWQQELLDRVGKIADAQARLERKLDAFMRKEQGDGTHMHTCGLDESSSPHPAGRRGDNTMQHLRERTGY